MKITLLYGGRSAEHEISKISAKHVLAALDRKKYSIRLIGIAKTGHWYEQAVPSTEQLRHAKTLDLIEAPNHEITEIIKLDTDVVFPVLHGPFGEDGTIQGLLKLANLPTVGAGVLSSAVCMDKAFTKHILKNAGLAVGDYKIYHAHEELAVVQQNILQHFALPCFIKPANLGSSVGISKVYTEDELANALIHAFSYDRKIIVEAYIKGREIECAVLGNHDPKASLPGEIIPQTDFYSYQAKYLDKQAASLQAPVDLPENITKHIQETAIKAFLALDCAGMARVDFFLNDDALIINEVNTIPGFTPISMYPKLWQATGLAYPALLDKLIDLALARFDEDQSLLSQYSPEH